MLYSEFLSRLFAQIKPLLIAIKYTTADLALNSKGMKFAYAPITLLNSAISRVLLPTFSNTKNDDEMIDKAISYLSVLSFFIFPMMFGLASISNVLVPVLLTDKWSGCENYIMVYCLMYLWSPLTIVNRRMIEAKGRGTFLATKSTVFLIIDILFLYISIKFFDNPIYVPLLMTICSTANNFVDSYYCDKKINFSIKMQVSSIKSSFILSIFMSILVLIVGKLFKTSLLTLIIQISIGASTYLLLNYLFNTKPYKILLKMIKK